MASLIVYPKRLKGVINIRPAAGLEWRAIAAAVFSSGKSNISNVDTNSRMLGLLQESGVDFKLRENRLTVNGLELQESRTAFFRKLFDMEELAAGDFFLRGDSETDSIIALLFGLPLLEEDSRIILTARPENMDDIDTTLYILEQFGILVECKDYIDFYVRGNQKYIACDYEVEGDWNQGAFFLLADFFGADITLSGLADKSQQAGSAVLDIFKRMGAKLHREDAFVRLYAGDGRFSTTIDAEECPSLLVLPILAASVSEGITTIINIDKLSADNYDRIQYMIYELAKLGARIDEKEDIIKIYGVPNLEGGCRVTPRGDANIAMSLFIAAAVCRRAVIIQETACIDGLYPEFIKEYVNIGGCIEERN